MAFGQVNRKLQEHYGITVPENGIRTHTLRHAQAIRAWQKARLGTIHAGAKEAVISQTDGSMIPIVKTRAATQEKTDRCKGKELLYREARLTLAREHNTIKPVFSATLGNVRKPGSTSCIVSGLSVWMTRPKFIAWVTVLPRLRIRWKNNSG